MTRAQRQAKQPKFTPRQWPSDPQSTYLLARAERLGEIRREEGRRQTKIESERWTLGRGGLTNRTRVCRKLGK